MTEDEMYSGRFYRSDGIKIAVHEGENFAGDKGFYWCESVTIKVTDEQGNYNPVYLTGNSGMGPFATAEEACRHGLNYVQKPA